MCWLTQKEKLCRIHWLGADEGIQSVLSPFASYRRALRVYVYLSDEARISKELFQINI